METPDIDFEEGEEELVNGEEGGGEWRVGKVGGRDGGESGVGWIGCGENTTKKLLLIVVVQWVSSHDDVQVTLSPWRMA